MPDVGAMCIVFQPLEIPRHLRVDCGSEAREGCLEAQVVRDTLDRHLRHGIHGVLQAAVALGHDTEHEVLEVTLRLLFLTMPDTVTISRESGARSYGFLGLTLNENRSYVDQRGG